MSDSAVLVRADRRDTPPLSRINTGQPTRSSDRSRMRRAIASAVACCRREQPGATSSPQSHERPTAPAGSRLNPFTSAPHGSHAHTAGSDRSNPPGRARRPARIAEPPSTIGSRRRRWRVFSHLSRRPRLRGGGAKDQETGRARQLTTMPAALPGIEDSPSRSPDHAMGLQRNQRERSSPHGSSTSGRPLRDRCDRSHSRVHTRAQSCRTRAGERVRRPAIIERLRRFEGV